MYTEFRCSLLLSLLALPFLANSQCPESLDNLNGFGTLSLYFESGQAPDDLQTIDIDFPAANDNVNANHGVNLVVADVYQTSNSIFSGVELTGDITLNYSDGSQEVCAYDDGDLFNPLPVELSGFSGTLAKEDILLSWTTASEEDNAGFEIEQSFDGLHFSHIGLLGGAGNSDTERDYNFVDTGVRSRALSNTSYYRLVQIDFDGKKTYSELFAIDLELAFEKFEITKVTGWDTSERILRVYFYNPYDIRKVNFLISDISGRIIERRSVYPIAGLNTFEVDLSDEKRSFYFLSLNNGKEIIGKKVVLASDY